MARFDGEVPELEVRRPSLEDIYLDLIASVGVTPDAAALEGAVQ